MRDGSLTAALIDGVLIDINIRAWTGEQQLTAADLGIPEDKIPKSFKLGKKPMVPPAVLSAFKHEDYLTRDLLLKLSFPWGDFGSARFVQLTNMVEFDAAFNVRVAVWNKLVDDLVLNWDKYKFEMRTDFIEAAKQAHERLSQLASFTTPLDQYINEFLERIEKKYPKVEKIREKYGITYKIKHESIPDLAEMSIADVVEEGTQLRMIFEAYEKKQSKELEKQAEVRVRYVCGIAEEVINDVIEAMAQAKKFTGKTVDKLVNMVERFKKLNVANDTVLEDALVTFKTKYLDGRTSEQIRKSKDIQAEMLESLKGLKDIVTNVERISALSEAYRNKTKK